MTTLRTKEDALALLKSIGALDTHRKLEGKERENIMFLTQLMEPVEETNNQHSWTSVYHVGSRVYNFHYFPGAEEPLVEEYIKYKDPT